MNFLELLKKIKPIEIGLLIVFALYIIIPSETPSIVASFVNSPLGFIFLFIVTISLFVYTNPILGVLFIIVAYELLRRSSVQPVFTSIMQNTPSQATKDQEMRAMNPPVYTTLEEEVVSLRAPIGRSSEIELVDSPFKPVSDKIITGSSMF
jgi:hypothetical protein